jgi:predicted DNA binding CopG/RHH family protein
MERRLKPMPKRAPEFRSDEEAEAFLEQDLSDLDYTDARPLHFELRRKDRAVSLRLSDALLAAVKQTANRQGIPYHRFMRQAIEQAVTPKPPAGKN